MEPTPREPAGMAHRQYLAVLITVVVAAALTGLGAWLTMPDDNPDGLAGGLPRPPISPAASAPGSPTSKPTIPPASQSPTKKSTPSATKTSARPRQAGSGSGPAGSMMYTGTKSVAMTFDDGPDPTYTPQILDLLKQYHVRATFCVVGFRARDYPDLIRRILNEGHTLCNHSWQHLLDLSKRDDAYIKRDMQKTNDAINAAAPNAKVKYFRAPGGNFTPEIVDDAASLGMKSLYWAIDPRDWDTSTFGTGSGMANHVIAEVKARIRQGSIILSHDMGKRSGTILAYKTLIPWMKSAGYSLTALPP